MWHSQFLCGAHHNKDTETPDGPKEDGIRHALFRLNVWARVITAVKTKTGKSVTWTSNLGNLIEQDIINSTDYKTGTNIAVDRSQPHQHNDHVT